MAYRVSIPENQIKRCNEIIYSHADMCRGLGNQLGRIPLADSAIIIQIQTAMIIKLATVFEQRIGEKTAQSIIASNLVHPSNLNKFMFQWLFRWMPGVGNTISVATAIKSTKEIGFRAADRLFTEKFDDADMEEESSPSVCWRTIEIVHKFRKNEIKLVPVKIEERNTI